MCRSACTDKSRDKIYFVLWYQIVDALWNDDIANIYNYCIGAHDIKQTFKCAILRKLPKMPGLDSMLYLNSFQAYPNTKQPLVYTCIIWHYYTINYNLLNDCINDFLTRTTSKLLSLQEKGRLVSSIRRQLQQILYLLRKGYAHQKVSRKIGVQPRSQSLRFHETLIKDKPTVLPWLKVLFVWAYLF